MIKQILYISIMVATFVFIGYNVLTAEASVDLNKEYTWTGPDGAKDKVTLNDFEVEDVEDTCDASEDYTRNEKLCNDLYEMKEESDKAQCKEVNGDWKKCKCTFYEDEQDHEVPITKDPITNEDWRNTVTPSDGNLKIPSTTTKYYDEDKEKQEEEIAEYNREADEGTEEEAEINEDAEEADSEEENDSDEEESDDSESEDDGGGDEDDGGEESEE